jgi:hypothetical protein
MLRAGHSRRPADRSFAACCRKLRAGHRQSSHRGAACAARRERRCSCAALSSQTPLPPQPPPTPCQTMCSAYGKGVEHTTQCRVFCADSPRRQDFGDTDQIALGGRSAAWHVLITRSRRSDTQVFFPPLVACACDACVRKSGVGGSSLQSPGPMCAWLLVCCRRSRVEMQRGLGPPSSAQPRLVALLHWQPRALAPYSALVRPNNSLACVLGRLERQLSFGYARSVSSADAAS